MPHIEVRTARTEDRNAILAFCQDTWKWGDYIEYVWDDWLHNPRGRLFVATVDEQPAGLLYMCMLTSHDAWLQGLRVDPAYRRQGIAKALNDAGMLTAMQRGATYVRLLTDSTNTRSIQISENNHMRHVSTVTLYTAPALSTFNHKSQVKSVTTDSPRLATMDDIDDIIDYLNASSIFPLYGGLYYVNFTARPITAEFLEEKVTANQVYTLRRWNRLEGIAIGEPRQELPGFNLSIGYIDGVSIEPLSLIAYDLRQRIIEIELEHVRIYAPDMVLVRDALTGIDYEWGEDIFYTYERGLT